MTTYWPPTTVIQENIQLTFPTAATLIFKTLGLIKLSWIQTLYWIRYWSPNLVSSKSKVVCFFQNVVSPFFKVSSRFTLWAFTFFFIKLGNSNHIVRRFPNRVPSIVLIHSHVVCLFAHPCLESIHHSRCLSFCFQPRLLHLSISLFVPPLRTAHTAVGSFTFRPLLLISGRLSRLSYKHSLKAAFRTIPGLI